MHKLKNKNSYGIVTCVKDVIGMKKILCCMLSLVMILSLAMPAYAEKSGKIRIEFIGTDAQECAKPVELLNNVLKENFGETDVDIVISVSGDPADWSIKYNPGGSVTLSGGSEAAIEYAVNKFLEEILIVSESEPELSAELDYSYSSENGTDNSALLSYKGGKDVKLMPSYSDGILLTPEWADSLIIVELRPDTASIGGTLPECRDLVDFYAKAGVNGIWLPPIYDRGEYGNGYSNFGPHSLEQAITGTQDYAEGWERVREFVDYAHSKGIYVFFDMVTWGAVFDSPFITDHPGWFDGEAWGNAAFNWKNEEFRRWFVETAIENILKTGADGYRCDCEPNYTGYEIYGEIRQRLKAEGKNIIIICEDANTRKSVYDFEQDGVLDYSVTDRAGLYSSPVNFFGDGIVNIVDSVKNGTAAGYPGWRENPLKRGTGKHYINCITNHDYQKRDVCGSLINIGYSAILAPYIPLWYMGDEFNVTNADGVQYFNSVDYSEAEDADNALFFESVKKMISIRRTYGEIFEYWPANHRNGNICKVESSGIGSLQSYARYSGNKAAVIVANNDESSTGGKVKIPFPGCFISGYKRYRLTDMTTGKVLFEGTKKEIGEFRTFIAYQQVGIYLVEGIGEKGFVLEFDFDRLFDKIYTEILFFIAGFIK